MLVVHIGLPKTATTTVQRHVFPELGSMVDDFEFNHQRLLVLCRKAHLLGLSEEERTEFSEIVSRHENTLISLESLVSWNPREWERAAQRNLELFGKEATIVITLRDPKAFLASVWYQMVHIGNAKEPERFFLRAEQYSAIEPLLRHGTLEYFDLDAFSYRRLCELYENRFRRVHVVPTEQLEHFRFLAEEFSISEQNRRELQKKFQNAPPANIAYSSLAIKLTFARERFLNRFGLKTRTLYDRDPLDIYDDFESRDTNRRQVKPFKNLTAIEKLLETPRRAHNRLKGALRWRRIMQGWVNRLLPYRRHPIPDSCLSARTVRDNQEFIRSLGGHHADRSGG